MAHLTAQEISYIRNSVRAGTKTTTIARTLGKTPKAVRELIRRHCPDRPRIGVAQEIWKTEEEIYLINHYQETDWPEILKNLPGRSRSSIIAKARYMDLRRRKPKQSRVSLEQSDDAPIIPQIRKCMTCPENMMSTGPGHRMCDECRRKAVGSTPEYSVAI